MRSATQGVFRLEDRIRDELLSVLILQPVEDPRSVLPGGDNARQSELRQVLRHCRRGFVHDVSQVIHRQLGSVTQRHDDADASRISQHREHFHGQLDVIAFGEAAAP